LKYLTEIELSLFAGKKGEGEGEWKPKILKRKRGKKKGGGDPCLAVGGREERSQSILPHLDSRRNVWGGKKKGKGGKGKRLPSFPLFVYRKEGEKKKEVREPRIF